MQSPFGGFLNELTDVISDAALYLPFALVAALSAELIIFIVLASLLVEMTGVVAVQVGASRRYDGPMGKSDRAFAFGILAILLGLGLDSISLHGAALPKVKQVVRWTGTTEARALESRLADLEVALTGDTVVAGFNEPTPMSIRADPSSKAPAPRSPTLFSPSACCPTNPALPAAVSS